MTHEAATSPMIEGELVNNMSLLDSLVEYVAIEDVATATQLLQENTADKPQVNWAILQKAIAFGAMVHEGQERKHDPRPAGQKKDFFTHPLAAALMVNDLLGQDVTTEQLVTTILHDAIEDGKIATEDGHRHVTRDDIASYFGENVAFGVQALSDVRDVRQLRGGTKRVKLEDPEYHRLLSVADTARPDLKLVAIKAGGDRSTNLIDPFTQLSIPEIIPVTGSTIVYLAPNGPREVKHPWLSRTRKLAHTKQHLLPIVDDSQVRNFLLDSMDLARTTLTPGFDRNNWKPKFLAQRNRRH